MKKACFLLMVFLFIAACGDKRSGDETDTSFRVTPGSLTKKNAQISSSTLEINSVQYTLNYAVIDIITVDSANYVGIALSDNPDPDLETINLKIYFQDDAIPTNNRVIPFVAGDTIKVLYNNQTYSTITSGSLTLTFTPDTTTCSIISQTGDTINMDNTISISNLSINALQMN